MAATAHLPQALDGRRAAIVAFPGSGYGRGYFDINVDGFPGYSQADYHTANGLILIAVDHLCVGDSTVPSDMDKATKEVVVDADAEAARQLIEAVRHGTLAADLPPIPDIVAIGMGQSLGGYLGAIVQARHAPFDALAVLGFSAIHTVISQPGGPVRVMSPAQLGAGIEQITDWVWPFHWEDEPSELVHADMGGGYPIRARVPPWGSATGPLCAFNGLLPAEISQDVAAIAVPVFLGIAERDVILAPHEEPRAYRSAPSVWTEIIPRMAHMHNFAPTREMLWRRIERFASAIAEERRATTA